MRSSAPLTVVLLVVALAAAIAAILFLDPKSSADRDPDPTKATGSSPARSMELAGSEGEGTRPAPPAEPDAVATAKPVTAPKRVEATAGTADAVAEAPKVGKVTGQVIDFNGNPAADVRIRIIGKKGIGFGPADATTDADGRFTAELSVAKKKTMRVRATRKDRLPYTVPEVVIKRGETTDIGTIQFVESGAVEVLVTDTSDRPVPNCEVRLAPVKKPGEGIDPGLSIKRRDEDPTEFMERNADLFRGNAQSDEQGKALFAAAKPGSYEVWVEAPALSMFGNIRARVRSTAPVGKGAGVSAKVTVGVDQTPESEKEDDTEPAAAEVGIPPRQTIQVSPGRTEKVVMVMRSMGTLRGRATLGGKPLAEEWLGLHGQSTSETFFGNFAGHVRAKTDKDGKFMFPPVPPGDYDIKKGDPGEPINLSSLTDPDDMMGAGAAFASRMMGGNDRKHDLSRKAVVLAGDNECSVDFGGALIEVFVQDADSGKPVSDATVRVFDFEPSTQKKREKDSSALRSAFGGNEALLDSFLPPADGRRPVRLRGKGDAGGRAEFQNIEPGNYRATARVSGLPSSIPVDFSVIEGEYKKIIIKMPEGVQISGTVNDRSGNAVEGAQVISVQEDTTSEPMFPDEILTGLGGRRGPSGLSDSKGVYKIKGLPRGAGKVLAVAEGYAPAWSDVVAPSEGNQLFLEKNGSIRIRVMRDGKPAKGVMVSLDKTSETAPIPSEIWAATGLRGLMDMQNHMDTTDSDGYALLKGVPPGDWTLNITNLAGPGTPAAATAGSAVDQAAKPDLDAARKAFESNSPQNIKVRVVSEQEASARLDLPAR